MTNTPPPQVDFAHTLLLISGDPDLVQPVTSAFKASVAFDLKVIEASPVDALPSILETEPKLAIVDLSSGDPADRDALGSLIGSMPAHTPVIVVADTVDSDLVRLMMHLRIADFLTKPIAARDLVKTCLQALGSAGDKGPVEAEIRTFLPAAGGVGATTLTLEAAYLLHKKGQVDGKGTCIVDLNFQHGSCADYLDIEPQFEIDEIENNPERLDRQLLEVMLSKHSSGLNVIAAPHQPSEMRSFKPEVVIRLLDLVSAHFENVVIDMPRIWFPWTETVLLGSNKLYVVADMTVPCIRNAERLVESIRRQIGEDARTGVIVNRYEERMFDGGLKRADLEEVLKGAFLGGVSNNYPLVREAVDKGAPLDEIKPDSNISADLGAILFAGEEVAEKKKKSLLGFLSRKTKHAA